MAATAITPRPGSRGAGDGHHPTGADGTGFHHLTFDQNGKNAAGKNEGRDKLRNKLIDVGQRFVGFDKTIEGDTVKRKQEEVQKVTSAQEGLMKLEKALNSEIRRRVDANKQVQAMTETLANDMLERLQTNILARVEKLAASIESLTRRCTALEKGISQFRGEMPSKLQVDTAALVKEISEMRRQMELDKKNRVERDTVLLKRLAEMESHEAAQFEAEAGQLTSEIDQLRNQVDSLAKTEEVDDTRTEKFRAFIIEEISGMKNTLAVSGQAREQTDDEIVEAMKQYTNALQKGLHAANNKGW